MSKMDALRAMREERYEQAQKTAQKSTGKSTPAGAGTGQPARRATPNKRPPVAPPATSGSVESAAVEAVETLCGHKNMSGRSCTRPHGHSEKSHRYS